MLTKGLVSKKIICVYILFFIVIKLHVLRICSFSCFLGGENMLVNGEDLDFNDEVNILDLISRLELSKDYIVIEVNGKIIAKEEYSTRSN